MPSNLKCLHLSLPDYIFSFFISSHFEGDFLGGFFYSLFLSISCLFLELYQTHFDGRLFELRITCGPEYPNKAPKVRFTSRINLSSVNQSTGAIENDLPALAQWNRNMTMWVSLFIWEDHETEKYSMKLCKFRLQSCNQECTCAVYIFNFLFLLSRTPTTYSFNLLFIYSWFSCSLSAKTILIQIFLFYIINHDIPHTTHSESILVGIKNSMMSPQNRRLPQPPGTYLTAICVLLSVFFIF